MFTQNLCELAVWTEGVERWKDNYDSSQRTIILTAQCCPSGWRSLSGPRRESPSAGCLVRWVRVPTGWVTLSKLLSLSRFPFPHLYDAVDHSTSTTLGHRGDQMTSQMENIWASICLCRGPFCILLQLLFRWSKGPIHTDSGALIQCVTSHNPVLPRQGRSSWGPSVLS